MYQVMVIYADRSGRACLGYSGITCQTLGQALKDVKRFELGGSKLAVIWVNRLEKQPDGSCKNVETPYLKTFIDIFGIQDATGVEVTDERGEPRKPVFRNNDKYECEMNECPVCGHIVEGEKSWEQFAYCPQCGQRIDWEGAERDALGEKGGAAP